MYRTLVCICGSYTGMFDTFVDLKATEESEKVMESVCVFTVACVISLWLQNNQPFSDKDACICGIRVFHCVHNNDNASLHSTLVRLPMCRCVLIQSNDLQ